VRLIVEMDDIDPPFMNFRGHAAFRLGACAFEHRRGEQVGEHLVIHAP